MIHLENPGEIYKRSNIALWLLSAFKAGFINSAGFLITGKYVSHVTGFGTQAGVALGHKDYFFGAELLLIPVTFILGGVITSLILERKYQNQEIPPYYLVQGLITVLIALVIVLGEIQNPNLVAFDSDNKYDLMEFFFISLLCFICGLKNSLVTWTTSGKIRVTHLTGLSTDIGLNLIKSFRSKEDRKVNLTRILTFLSFSSGAIISAISIPIIGFKGFLIIFGISLVMTMVSVIDFARQTSRRGYQIFNRSST